MGDRTSIEWTDATWNPIRARWIAPTNDGSGVERVGWHCEPVSEGCRNCYAESINRRLGTQLEFKPDNRRREVTIPPRGGPGSPREWRGEATVFLDEKMLLAPLRWRRPRRIFVCSMTDLFADFVPDAMLDRIFAIMALCPQHTFQVLTKRPSRMRAYLSDPGTPGRIGRRCVDLWLEKAADLVMRFWPLLNVWLGTSCEDQATADARIPDLLATPAAIRFVSAEPLLGPIDFLAADIYAFGRSTIFLPKRRADSKPDIGLSGGTTLGGAVSALGGFIRDEGGGLDWVVVGGESGPNARPMHPDWARSIRDQCAVADTAFFFKQWGKWAPLPEPEFSGVSQRSHALFLSVRGKYEPVGKRAAGRLLDGVVHDGMPRHACEVA